MIRVLGRASSINVRKVLWTLDEIGAPYAHEGQWGADGNTRSPEFLKLNPRGLIPVLIDENGPLAESNAICRYLARKHARRDLLPLSPEGAAAVETWMDWQASDLNMAWRPALLSTMRGDGSFGAEAVAASVAAWNTQMALLDARLADVPYAAGEAFSLADIVLGLSAHRWRSTPMPRAELPHVARWLARLAERPPFARHASAGYP